MKACNLPVMPQQCATCPFRPESKYHNLMPDLAKSALTEASRICHSTGNNGIHRRTGRPSMLCRGARNLQLQLFASIGFIEDATDAAWDKKLREISTEGPSQPRKKTKTK